MITPNRNMLLLPALVASLGFAGSAAAQFTIGATVSNAIEIQETLAMSFGNLFATVTEAGGAATNSARVEMNPQGTVSIPAAPVVTAPPVVYLNGAAAGAYRIPSVPIGSTVIVEIQDSNGEAASWVASPAAAATCNYSDAIAAIADKRIILTAGGPGAGTFSAFFCVDGFTARSAANDATAALIGTGVLQGTGFDVTGPTGGNIDFTLGATLIAQSATTGVTNFENTAYSGIFNMEVLFQ